MGLHAQIHQNDQEVSIALSGEVHSPEYDQLVEIVKHFRNRGCHEFVLDLKGIARLNKTTEESLRRLVEERRSRRHPRKQIFSAIRP